MSTPDIPSMCDDSWTQEEVLMQMVPNAGICSFEFVSDGVFLSPSSIIGVLSNLGEINSFAATFEDHCSEDCTTVRVLNGTNIVDQKTNTTTSGSETITITNLSNTGANGFIISTFEAKLVSITIDHTRSNCVSVLNLSSQDLQGNYFATSEITATNTIVKGNTSFTTLQTSIFPDFSVVIGEEFIINKPVIVDCF